MCIWGQYEHSDHSTKLSRPSSLLAGPVLLTGSLASTLAPLWSVPHTTLQVSLLNVNPTFSVFLALQNQFQVTIQPTRCSVVWTPLSLGLYLLYSSFAQTDLVQGPSHFWFPLLGKHFPLITAWTTPSLLSSLAQMVCHQSPSFTKLFYSQAVTYYHPHPYLFFSLTFIIS